MVGDEIIGVSPIIRDFSLGSRKGRSPEWNKTVTKLQAAKWKLYL
jgi:hypothetical protein